MYLFFLIISPSTVSVDYLSGNEKLDNIYLKTSYCKISLSLFSSQFGCVPLNFNSMTPPFRNSNVILGVIVSIIVRIMSYFSGIGKKSTLYYFHTPHVPLSSLNKCIKCSCNSFLVHFRFNNFLLGKTLIKYFYVKKHFLKFVAFCLWYWLYFLDPFLQ